MKTISCTFAEKNISVQNRPFYLHYRNRSNWTWLASLTILVIIGKKNQITLTYASSILKKEKNEQKIFLKKFSFLTKVLINFMAIFFLLISSNGKIR